MKFYTVEDIPGKNSFTPLNVGLMTEEEEILCKDKVKYYGQAAAIIVADREKTATKAAQLVKIKYKPASTKPLLTIKDVLDSTESESRVRKDIVIKPTETGENVENIIRGEFSVGSQYHYQMETQTCIAIPSEDGMDVYAATQWIDFTNVAIAECLNISMNK